MASWTIVTPTNSTVDGSSFTSSSFTPATNDLLVVCVYAAVNNANTPTLTSSVGGATFTLSVAKVTTSATCSCYVFTANQLATNASQTVTFDCSGFTATACVINIFRLSGMTKTGSTAIRQSCDKTLSGGTSVNPVFASTTLSSNPILAFVGTGDSTPGLTVPTGFTLGAETITSTPADASVTGYADSGITTTTSSWSGTLNSSGFVIHIEYDASAISSGARSFGFVTG